MSAEEAAANGAAVVFYARYLYLNPSFPRLLAHFAEGRERGVRAIDTTRVSPAEVDAALGRAGVAVIDQSLANAATWPNVNESPFYHVVDAKPPAHYAEILDRVLEAALPRALLANSDLHDPRDDALHARFGGRVEALIWLFGKRPPEPASIPELYRDPFAPAVPVDEIWTRVRERFPIRVETWFAVAAEEFVKNPGRRLWDACVPGAGYRTRMIAQKALREEGQRLAPFRALQLPLRALTRAAAVLPRSATRSARLIALHHTFQRDLVARSAVSFVCGSGLRYPVRKFLEIPACRSAMIAYPCTGFEDFGFRDGVHALVTTPEDAGRTARRLRSDDRLRDRLVERAVRFVCADHTIERRAEQLRTCFHRLARNDLRGAGFAGGEFVVC